MFLGGVFPHPKGQRDSYAVQFVNLGFVILGFINKIYFLSHITATFPLIGIFIQNQETLLKKLNEILS